MRAVFDELFVNGMHLVSVLAFNIVKEHELGYAEAIVDNVALFGAGRDADPKAFNGFYFFQRF